MMLFLALLVTALALWLHLRVVRNLERGVEEYQELYETSYQLGYKHGGHALEFEKRVKYLTWFQQESAYEKRAL